MSRGRPRAEPRSAQHQRIVDAARRAFTEQGYDAVSLAGVAREAGVSRAVVYDVVGTKEALLGAVADAVADELIAEVDEHLAGPDDGAPLTDVVRGNIRWIVDRIGGDPATAAIIRLSGRLAHSADDPASRARKRIEDRLTALHVAHARALGLDREATARVLSVAVLSMIEHVAVRTAEEGWDPDAVAELVGEFALGGYLRTEDEGTADSFEQSGR